MNILHFAGNANCIPCSHDLFEQAVPGASRWRVLGWPADRNRGALVGVSSNYFTGNQCSADLEWADLLICHSMHPQFIPALQAIPEHVALLWRLWGFEYHHFRERELGGLYLEKTAAIRRRMVMTGGIAGGFGRVLRGAKSRFQRYLTPNSDGAATIGARVDLVTGFRGEIDILRRNVAGFHAKPVWFNYMSLNERSTFRAAGQSRGERGVQIGNSATFTNNHVEAIAMAEGLVPADESVVSPLNYGDMRYADIVEAQGKAVFKGEFVPLRTHMPIADYYAMLRSTCAFIMNSRIQQGMGNITQALQDGKRIYLRPENVMLDDLRADGFHIFSVDDLLTLGRDAIEPLPLSQQRENHDRVVASLMNEVVLDEIRALEPAVESVGRRRGG